MIRRNTSTGTSPRLLAAAGAAALTLLTLTACGGTTHAGPGTGPASAGAGTGPASSAAATSSPSTPAPEATAAKAAHDRAFPDVAARCDGAGGTARATGSAKPVPRVTDPEAAKYAENHAFKQQARLSPEALCRGEAHAQRIRKALVGPGAKTPANEAALTAVLVRLGYEADSGTVHRTGGSLGFSSFVPVLGPCVTGRLGSPATFEAHGVYLEGGCTEPRGGH
ncbi:hypothetical protein [Streptomyces sp. NPDC058657]|uniref:hypothetical protein n=1 Tax=unclassified Streptomyces TaxID=2593676 RepID=UPI003646C3A9